MEAQILNYKLSEIGQPTYVHDYIQQSAIELYAAPMSAGNLIFEID